MNPGPLTTIVLSGGPRAGKTTVMQLIVDRLKSMGYNVFVAPEAASLLMSTGVSFRDVLSSDEETFYFQERLVKQQQSIEEFLAHYAETVRQNTGKHTVVICDRGILDAKAYMKRELWDRLITESLNMDEMMITNRYDGVLFLRTSAWGKEDFYTQGVKDNSVRFESAEEARQTDQRLLNAWSVHDHLTVIGNETDFNEKCKNVIKAIERIMGVPMPAQIRRKYILRSAPNLTFDSQFFVEQIFLQTNDPNEQMRLIIRKQGSKDTFTLMRTQKLLNEKIETERSLNFFMYKEFLTRVDQTRKPLKVKRSCFLLDNQFFKVDEYIGHHEGLVLLQIETDDPTTVHFPPGVDVVRDVTEDMEFSSYMLARESASVTAAVDQ